MSAMENLKEMIDVNTVVGKPVDAMDGTTIIPVSKVSFGFVAGGGEYAGAAAQREAHPDQPFAGGAGAGVSVQPVGFLVCGRSGVKLLRTGSGSALERLAEAIPQALEALKTEEEGDKERSPRPAVRAAYQDM